MTAVLCGMSMPTTHSRSPTTNNCKQMNTKRKTHTINVGSRVYLTDPCYPPGTWCQVTTTVKPGAWRCHVEFFTNELNWRYVSKLICRHEDYPDMEIPKAPAFYSLGVDSGQFGMFDADFYEKINSDEKKCQSIYSRICQITLNDDKGCTGTVNGKGIVTRSGYGDGSYSARVAKDENGTIVCVEIDFITDDVYEEYMH